MSNTNVWSLNIVCLSQHSTHYLIDKQHLVRTSRIQFPAIFLGLQFTVFYNVTMSEIKY